MKGLKTYIGSIAIGVAGLALYFGWLTAEQCAVAGLIIAAFTGVSMRAAVKKTERAAKTASKDAVMDLEVIIDDVARKVAAKLKNVELPRG